MFELALPRLFCRLLRKLSRLEMLPSPPRIVMSLLKLASRLAIGSPALAALVPAVPALPAAAVLPVDEEPSAAALLVEAVLLFATVLPEVGLTTTLVVGVTVLPAAAGATGGVDEAAAGGVLVLLAGGVAPPKFSVILMVMLIELGLFDCVPSCELIWLIRPLSSDPRLAFCWRP